MVPNATHTSRLKDHAAPVTPLHALVTSDIAFAYLERRTEHGFVPQMRGHRAWSPLDLPISRIPRLVGSLTSSTIVTGAAVASSPSEPLVKTGATVDKFSNHLIRHALL